MKTKEYIFKEGFTIKPRLCPDGIVFAMGEAHVCESNVFELYLGESFSKEYKTFEEAKKAGMGISLDKAKVAESYERMDDGRGGAFRND